jgi:hypothetical protein
MRSLLGLAVLAGCATSSAVDASGRVLVRSKQPIYCTTWTQDSDIGACSPVEAECVSSRFRLIEGGDTYTRCNPAKGAACFRALRVADGAEVTLCAPSVTGCDEELAERASDPEYAVRATRCSVYRVVR